jgi:hypothetical protein
LLKFRFSSDGKEIGGFDIEVLELQPGKRVTCGDRERQS